MRACRSVMAVGMTVTTKGTNAPGQATSGGVVFEKQ